MGIEWFRDLSIAILGFVTLNETGLKQAKLLAQYLKEVGIEAIYSSPLKRALVTSCVRRRTLLAI